MKIYVSILLLFFSFILKAQESKTIIDLKSKLDTASTLKSRTSLLGQLSGAYAGIQKPDSAIVYTDKMLTLNAEIDDKVRLGSINVFMSQHYLQKGKPDGAYPYLIKAEKLLEKSTDANRLGELNIIFGAYYFYKKETQKGGEYFKRNVDLYNQGKAIDKNIVMLSYQNLFATSYGQNNLKNSFEAIIL
jgi:adenylate cyclase